jgi:uncharacterized protein YraI
VAVTIPGGNSGWSQSADLIISNLAEVPVVDPVTGLAVPTPVAETPSSGVVAGTDSSSDPVAPSLPPTATGPTRTTATVNVGNSRLNIRSGPSTDFPILGKANQADILDVVGRNTTATWVQVVTPGVGSGVSWVSADYVSLSQPILGIADVETVDQPIVASPPVVSPPVESPPEPATVVTPVNPSPIGDINCTTDQIAKWDDAQGVWVCSDGLAQLQADVTALRLDIQALRQEIEALRASLAISPAGITP